MKPTAYFINVGRGATVDEAALARALAQRRIAAAAVDVFAQEPPAARPPALRARQRHRLASRLRLRAQLRRLVHGSLRREPAPLPGRGPAAQSSGPRSRLLSVTAAELDRHRYVSLATFRRNGAEVATPVWFAAVADKLYVVSAGDAGKVKRLRHSPRARVAPCDARGGVHGEWHDATAQLISDPGLIERSRAALRRSTAGRSAFSISSRASPGAAGAGAGSRSCCWRPRVLDLPRADQR